MKEKAQADKHKHIGLGVGVGGWRFQQNLNRYEMITLISQQKAHFVK